MTKSDLIDAVSEDFSQLSRRDIEAAIKLILEELSNSLAKGHRIEIRGFGSFSVRRHDARVARNPKTGDKVNIAARHLPYFRPGKELKARVNNVD